MDSLQTPDRAVRIATDLVNTNSNGAEALGDPALLRQFLLDHAEPPPVNPTARDVALIHPIRQQLRTVYQAERSDDAAAVLNSLLAEHASRPFLSDHDDTTWHVHVTAVDAGWPRWIAATTALGLATTAAGHGFEALRVCAAAGCDVVFVSTAGKRVRRYCSSTCATRTRVTSHRARRRQTSQ